MTTADTPVAIIRKSDLDRFPVSKNSDGDLVVLDQVIPAFSGPEEVLYLAGEEYAVASELLKIWIGISQSIGCFDNTAGEVDDDTLVVTYQSDIDALNVIKGEGFVSFGVYEVKTIPISSDAETVAAVADGAVNFYSSTVAMWKSVITEMEKALVS